MSGRLPEVFITAPVRTPIGSYGGSLLEFSAPQLGRFAAQACIQRSGLSPESIDQVIMGHGRQAGAGPNPARQVLFFSGIPQEREAFTVNQACNSGLKAIMLAAQEISLGHAENILAGGMESMSNTPYYLMKARFGMRMGHGDLLDGMYRDGFLCPLCEQVMGETAENLVDQYGISRKEQDEFACRSQRRCEEAQSKNCFEDEIEPVTFKKGILQQDEHPRGGVTVEKLAKLKPVFRTQGTIHAGNACGVTDGGAAVLVTNEKTLSKIPDGTHTPKARIVGFAMAGVDPKTMGLGPVPAVKKVLDQTGLKLNQMDLIELNEAFAAQVLACDRELKINPEKLNVNGGSIALGHPIGATGTRIVVTLMHEMKRRQAKYGLATLCVSGGLGGALILERV